MDHNRAESTESGTIQGEDEDSVQLKVSEDSEPAPKAQGDPPPEPEISANCDNQADRGREEVGGGEGDEVDEEDEEDVDDEGWEDILGSGRLKKKVIEAGDTSAERPQNGDAVKIGLEVFVGGDKDEAEWLVALPWHELEFFVGECEVVQAVDITVPLMRPGEETLVRSCSDFAYGGIHGLPDAGIAAGATVQLKLKLIECLSCISKTEMSIDERLGIGQRKKDRGNVWYSRGEIQMATQCYKRAVEFFDDERLDLDAPIDKLSLEDKSLRSMLDERVKTLNNLSLCQYKQEAWDSALDSLRAVLKIEPNNEKALYRKATVLQEKHRTEEAMGLLRRVIRLYPQNKKAAADLAKLGAKLKKHKESEARMSKKMLGLDRYEEEKRKQFENSWWRMWKKVSPVAAVGLAGAVVGVAAAAYARLKLWTWFG